MPSGESFSDTMGWMNSSSNETGSQYYYDTMSLAAIAGYTGSAVETGSAGSQTPTAQSDQTQPTLTSTPL